MSGGTSLFDLFLGTMGVYAVIGGIRGKGRLFSTRNVKEAYAGTFMKWQRILYVVLGVFMVLNSGFALLLSNLYESTAVDKAWQYTPKVDLGQWSFLTGELLNKLSFAFMLLSLLTIAGLVVLIQKCTDRKAAKENAEKDASGGGAPRDGARMPSAAFDFPDEPAEEKKKK